ncbi:unnamed protein product [Pleuronectes platessa]|uniref:Uncharacterized protein n=1 Tax=Pleuronectes platessa TaxID=8262 RepID=A0A9N7U3T7_PLEPL|nr:unnamed protein product [Pleuronectes platessa]
MRSQEGLLCLPAQAQEHGGDTRRPAITRGELHRAVEWASTQQQDGICSLVRGGTGGALPEQIKMTSSRLLEAQEVRVPCMGPYMVLPAVGVVLASHAATGRLPHCGLFDWQPCPAHK